MGWGLCVIVGAVGLCTGFILYWTWLIKSEWLLIHGGVIGMGLFGKSIFMGLLSACMGSVKKEQIGKISGIFFLIDSLSGYIFKQIVWGLKLEENVEWLPKFLYMAGFTYGILGLIAGTIMHILYDRTLHPLYATVTDGEEESEEKKDDNTAAVADMIKPGKKIENDTEGDIYWNSDDEDDETNALNTDEKNSYHSTETGEIWDEFWKNELKLEVMSDHSCFGY